MRSRASLEPDKRDLTTTAFRSGRLRTRARALLPSAPEPSVSARQHPVDRGVGHRFDQDSVLPLVVQCEVAGGPAMVADDELKRVLTSPSPGQLLYLQARRVLEPRFGYSFANVRVHADNEANRLASGIGAVAFTSGQHMFFRTGRSLCSQLASRKTTPGTRARTCRSASHWAGRRESAAEWG